MEDQFEIDDAREWQTPHSTSLVTSKPTHPRTPGPSNSRTHASQASISNNPFALLGSESPATSETSSGVQEPVSPTPQPSVSSEKLIDIGDNGLDQQLAPSQDHPSAMTPGMMSLSEMTSVSSLDVANYQGLEALSDRSNHHSQPLSRGSSPQARSQPAPSPRGLRGWRARDQYMRGRGSPTPSTVISSRGPRGYRGHPHGNNHYVSGPPSSASWSNSRGFCRGSASGHDRGRGSGLSRGSPHKTTSGSSRAGCSDGQPSTPHVISFRVNKDMADFLANHKEKHGSHHPSLQEIAAMTNTRINPVPNRLIGKDCEFNVMELSIQGSVGDAVHAENKLKEWTKEMLNKFKPKWAPAPGGFIPHVEKFLARAIREKEVKDKFRKPRPENLPNPAHSVRVVWTSRILPEQMLGSNCQALDPIRTDNFCWITCERSEGRFIFKLEGDDDEKIRLAAERLKRIHVQAEAKRFDAETVYILDVADDVGNLPSVHISEYTGSSMKSLGKLPRFVTLTRPTGYTGNTGPEVTRTLMESIRQMTDYARFFRNYLAFRAHLGTFVMTTYPANTDTFDFDQFDSAMGENGMRAFVTNEVGNSEIESTLLQRVCQASRILNVPDSSPTYLAELMEKPVYSATFKFNDSGLCGRLMLDVELSFEEGSTTVEQLRWYRIEHGKEDLRKILDVNMVNLSRGFAWNLGMIAAEPVDASSLSENYRDFPASLEINNDRQDFLVYGRYGAKVPLHSVYQRRLWRFETNSSGHWSVEVSEGHETIFSGRNTSHGSPRWTLDVINVAHEALLASNARTKIGELADWGSDVNKHPVEELFPTGSAPIFPEDVEFVGLEQLLRILRGLHDVVVEDPTFP